MGLRELCEAVVCRSAGKNSWWRIGNTRQRDIALYTALHHPTQSSESLLSPREEEEEEVTGAKRHNVPV